MAATPGKVVFRNHLIELIQYTPTTDKVYPEPLLIVPSCIMKYYILDLSPQNSMVKYLVDQGHTVFIISWRNPDANDRDVGMQDYLRLGVMEALAAVKSRSGASRVHTVGYCLGGTFLAIVAAVLGRLNRKKNKTRTAAEQAMIPTDMPELASVILLAAQTDFSSPGELGVFIDEGQIAALRRRMNKQGYLSGKQMGGSFVFLSSRGLLWGRNTRRYLLGEDDASLDLMSWNADTTRLPGQFHCDLLELVEKNPYVNAGTLEVLGVPVDMGQVKLGAYVIAGITDHITPWRACYGTARLFGPETTFVLANAGHLQSMINPPGVPKAFFFSGPAATDDPMAWAEGAQPSKQEGSWWPHWREWIKGKSGELKPAPAKLGSRKYRPLAPAPGTYVMER